MSANPLTGQPKSLAPRAFPDRAESQTGRVMRGTAYGTRQTAGEAARLLCLRFLPAGFVLAFKGPLF